MIVKSLVEVIKQFTIKHRYEIIMGVAVFCKNALGFYAIDHYSYNTILTETFSLFY